MSQVARQRVLDRLMVLGSAELGLADVADEANRLIARALPHDASCWHTTDPATLVETGYRAYAMPHPDAQVAEFAYLTTDFNSLAALVEGPRHSGVLSEAAGGRLDRSPRYRELLRPNNIRGELRTALVADGACWGCFALFREAPRDFTEDERDYAHLLASVLGRLIRAAGLRGRTEGTGPVPWPGAVVLDAARQVVSITDAARTWLADLGSAGAPGDPGAGALPFPMLTAVERVRESGRAVDIRVLGSSGRWIQLHAEPASGREPNGVAVVVQAAPPDSIAALICASYGFTARERELVALVLRGHRTSEIAARLHISPHTVQAHLKSVFAKAGVRSRAELVGRRFLRP
ncbi:LuxR C-terminal-related transcriptional regulator [Actinomadura sp. 1N219]|uniref:helix-turn-helix transcriptional regulator n=1 Tax=Actinomadura sp. 1N219 TaxID=3375152 RepID=UPI0037990E68